jgi:Ca2+-binding EF-hand superfamily protein
LVGYIKWSGISTNTILKIADTNHDSVIDLGEFKVLVGKLNFNVTDEEIKEMFDRISKNGDNKITIN